MILDTTLLKLVAVLGGAVATSQPDVHVDYMAWKDGFPSAPATYRAALNSTTDVTILPAPPTGQRYEPLRVVIYNKDTAAVTVTVKTDDGTTQRIETKSTVATLRSWVWEKNVGWYPTT